MVERIRTLLENRQLTPTQFADLIGVARPIVSHILSGRNKPSLEVVQRILAAMPDLAMPWLLNGSGPMLATASPLADAAPSVAVTPAPPVRVVPIVEAVPAQTVGLQVPENQLHYPETLEDTAPIPPVSTPAERHSARTAERVSKPAVFKSAALAKRFIANPVTAVKPGESDQSGARGPVEPLLEPVSSPAGLGDAAVVAGQLATAAANVTPLSQPANSATFTGDAAPGSAMAAALFAGAEKPIRRIVIFYRDGSFADYQPE